MSFIDEIFISLKLVFRISFIITLFIIGLIVCIGGILAFIDWINRKFFLHKFIIGKHGSGKEAFEDRMKREKNE